MTATETRFQCRHILADGRRCRSACLRHEDFCYYHHASRRPVERPKERQSRRSVFTLPRIEDRSSILLAINEIIARIAANDIDARRAGRLLYALQIAACSMPRIAPLKPSEEDAPGLVEEVVLHPTLGEIAPRAELLPPEPAQPRKSLAQELREEMEALEARNILEFGASADNEAAAHHPKPEILPRLEAATTLTSVTSEEKAVELRSMPTLRKRQRRYGWGTRHRRDIGAERTSREPVGGTSYPKWYFRWEFEAPFSVQLPVRHIAPQYWSGKSRFGARSGAAHERHQHLLPMAGTKGG